MKNPLLRGVALPIYRSKIAVGVIAGEVSTTLAWLFGSRETTNLTYELSPINKSHLAAFLSQVTGASFGAIEEYFSELEGDADLARHVSKCTVGSVRAGISDRTARFHKRLGWYALVRILKPRLVVETGVDKGLGSVVLCAALLRNRSEGAVGRYLGTDINPTAGFLLCGKYADVGEILFGDSLESLATIQEPIDIFINDSDHSADYEMREYELVAPKLSEHAVIVGDNAHVTDKLMRFSRERGRNFLYWQEIPLRHWYRGAGIGASWVGHASGPVVAGPAAQVP